MLDVLDDFVAELRAAGLPVSTTELLDAASALRQIPIADRGALKDALGATMIKSQAHWPAFDTVFEVFFALRGEGLAIPGKDRESQDAAEMEALRALDDRLRASGMGRQGGGGAGLSPEDLIELIYHALSAENAGVLEAAAGLAVLAFAGMEPGRPVGGVYYLYRTMRRLDMDRLAVRLADHIDRERAGSGSGLDRRLASDEARRRLEAFRRQIETEIRRRLVSDRGASTLARSIRPVLVEDVEFMHSSRDEMAALARALAPMARRLAVRLERRRRHGRRGVLDFRSTFRRALSTGGVPLDPRFHPPHAAKPELCIVADISGSVASFARFTLQLVYAIGAQFSKVRSFAFVDGIDEVTRFFDHADDPGEAARRVSTEADVLWVDGHSDYGHAFQVFEERFAAQLTQRTTVILLGDARNNYHASGSEALASVRQQVKHVYWLNPEPRAYWDTGDSVMAAYEPYCDGVFECRNLRQLEAFIEELI